MKSKATRNCLLLPDSFIFDKQSTEIPLETIVVEDVFSNIESSPYLLDFSS